MENNQLTQRDMNNQDILRILDEANVPRIYCNQSAVLKPGQAYQWLTTEGMDGFKKPIIIYIPDLDLFNRFMRGAVLSGLQKSLAGAAWMGVRIVQGAGKIPMEELELEEVTVIGRVCTSEEDRWQIANWVSRGHSAVVTGDWPWKVDVRFDN